MDSLKINRNRFQFFFENAGYVVGERAKCAYELAQAEAELLTRHNLWIDWEPESDIDLSWDETGEITKKLHSGNYRPSAASFTGSVPHAVHLASLRALEES